ncbi:MAG: tetratricopeptide repeat protein [Kiritimatiellia bacterium]
MIPKSVVIAIILGASAIHLKADFTDDFQNALKLYNGGKNEEACEAFTALAKVAPKPGAKSDALRYAVLGAINAKQFDNANELIPQIPRESTKKLCRMNLMLAQNQPQSVIDTFKDEDLAQWSDFHIYDALVARGQAYRRLKQYAEALRDFRKAEDFTSEPAKKAGVLNLTGGTLQEAGDDEQALVVWRRMEDITPLKGYGIINDATVNAARILAKQGKYDEALKEMNKIKLPEAGHWHAKPLVVEAEIYAAQGRKTEALAKYEEALKGAPEDMKKSIAAAVEKLKQGDNNEK